MRYAIVTNARNADEAKAYLPDNYRIVHAFLGGSIPGRLTEEYVIAGEDVAGWTLDGYVIPRFASGLIQCREIDAYTHPIFEHITVGALTA